MKTPPATAPLQKKPLRQAGARRRGVVLLIVVVLLFVAMLITLEIARAMAHQHRQIRLRQRELQAVWLAESAIERATAQLRLDQAYAGETWTLSPDELAGDMAGTVEIQTTRLDGQPGRHTVSVVADYPPDLPHRVRFSKSVVVGVFDVGGPS